MATYAEYPWTPTQRADVPAGAGGAPTEFPPPGSSRPEPFQPAFGYKGSQPTFSDTNIDPHNQDYEVVHGLSPVGGPLAGNIVDGSPPGPFSSSKPVWTRPGPQPDPHGD